MKNMIKLLLAALLAFGCSDFDENYEEIEIATVESALTTPPNPGIRFPDNFVVRTCLVNGDFNNGFRDFLTVNSTTWANALVGQGYNDENVFNIQLVLLSVPASNCNQTTDILVRKDGRAACSGNGCWPYGADYFHISAFDDALTIAGSGGAKRRRKVELTVSTTQIANAAVSKNVSQTELAKAALCRAVYFSLAEAPTSGSTAAGTGTPQQFNCGASGTGGGGLPYAVGFSTIPSTVFPIDTVVARNAAMISINQATNPAANPFPVQGGEL